jgi:ADP-ribose pyrophosphatase YjhB (NUDIX family)
MNIFSFFQSFQVNVLHTIKDRMINSVPPLQKRVVAIAVLILTGLAVVAYVFYRLYLAKELKVEKKGVHQAKEDDLVPNERIQLDILPHQENSKPIITQRDYLAYKHALDDVRLVLKCHQKDELHKIEVIRQQFRIKLDNPVKKKTTLEEWMKSAQTEDPLKIRDRIQVINNIHSKLLECQNEQSAGEYLLAADLYNTSLKIIKKWNALIETHPGKELLIQAPHLSENHKLQLININAKPLTEREKALNRYFELLDQYPQIKRTGDKNDHLQGTYEIVYDREVIREIQDLTYENLYKRTKSHELAYKGSLIGVVYEDSWGLILRDPVISPHEKKHTYIRFIWKSQLNGIEAGAAILPFVKSDDGIKIALILTNRHATSWEFEIPRGGARANETSEQTAQRELLEETGYIIDKPIYFGKIAPDTGIVSSVIPVFGGEIKEEKVAKQDKTEAIKGKFLFSLKEIETALKNKHPDGNSYLKVTIDGVEKEYPIRDPFFMFALLQYKL